MHSEDSPLPTSSSGLWGPEVEEIFLREELARNGMSAVERLFYPTPEGMFVFYWPRHRRDKSHATAQGRNSLIGHFTETWAHELLSPLAQQLDLAVVSHVVSPALGLSKGSPADLAFVRDLLPSGHPYPAEDVLLVVEVKMSLVWNWGYDPGPPPRLERLGDYTTHSGRPSLLRSDTMLKAIGKAASVRAAGPAGLQVPMIILGNAPIPVSYQRTVDGLRAVGLIQHFISVTPNPLDTPIRRRENIKRTPNSGFIRVDTVSELYDLIANLLQTQEQTFTFRLSFDKIGLLINQACQEAVTPTERGRRFLALLEAIHDNGENTEETSPF